MLSLFYVFYDFIDIYFYLLAHLHCLCVFFLKVLDRVYCPAVLFYLEVKVVAG